MVVSDRLMGLLCRGHAPNDALWRYGIVEFGPSSVAQSCIGSNIGSLWVNG